MPLGPKVTLLPDVPVNVECLIYSQESCDNGYRAHRAMRYQHTRHI